MGKTVKTPQNPSDSEEAKRDKTVAALLSTPSFIAAAKALGISESTLTRRLREPDIAQAYRDARREVVTHAIVGIQRAGGQAVATLTTVMSDSAAPASARVSAAKAVLDTGVKAVELEDLAARLDYLESLIGDNK